MTLKIFRRTHMYFGLVLVPFVLLYGVTALLFNHPSWFASSTTTTNDPALFDSAELPSPRALAEQLVGQLSALSEVPIELVEGEDPTFRGLYTIDLEGDDERLRYRVYPNSMASTTSITPLVDDSEEEEEQEEPFPEKIDFAAAEEMNEQIVQTIEEDSGVDSASVRGAPDLEMTVRSGDDRWILEYDLRTGDIAHRKAEESRRDFDFRSYLLRLHKSRGYPMELGARTYWGIIVDITAALMIFWALSGIIMWWQLRPTRNVGALTMLGGILLAGALGYAMFLSLYF